MALVGLNTWTFLDIAHAHKRIEMCPCHAAGANHADDFGVFAAHIFDANTAICTDPHMLQHAIIDEGQRRAGFDIRDEDQAAICAGFCAVFLLTADAFIFGLVNDVGLHPNGEIAAN